jgi:NADH-quinone oxidoreductase subunit N
VISAYYYLRVVMNMFTGEPESAVTFQPSPYLGLAMLIAVVGLLAIGVYPNPLVSAADHAARIFG